MIKFNIENNIIDLLASDDTIYHYCKTNTAIEYILFNLQIRLSKRLTSVDPIEGTMPWITDSYFFEEPPMPEKKRI